jgi:phospholipid/cholesterol/gamma-HCH transport system permease protein
MTENINSTSPVLIIPMRILEFLAVLGRITLDFIQSVGNLSIFAFNGITSAFRFPIYFRVLFKQMVDIGFYSLPVVGMTAIFTGAVLVLQSYTGFSRQNFGAESAIANIVVLSITRELGPVLAGLMIAGRVGAAMAAEIGTMRVTEQIDALYTLSTNPFKFLVAPRLLAGLITLPLLVLVSDSIGVFGGYLVSIHKLGFNPESYLRSTMEFLERKDVISGLVKAATFGFIICLMGCYHGFHSKGGAQGVGKATTNAVVSAFILILFSNYLITELFFSKS